MDIFKVYNAEDLLIAFKNKEPYIAIKGEYKEEITKLAASQLSETELMGLELGSQGTAGILAEIFYQIANFFSKEPNEKRKIESALRKYKLKSMMKMK